MAVDSTPCGLARSSKVCLRLPHHSFRKADAGYRLGMTTTAEHLRNTLDGRWRDVKNRVREELSTEIFKPHYTPNTVIARTKVAEQLKIMAASGCRGGRLQEGTRRQRRRRRGGDPDRDAGDVRPVADGQGRCAVGPVRRRHREPRHRAPPRGVRPEDHRPRAARLLRDDRDRPRQRRAGAGDHRDLRSGDPGVRHRLPHPHLAQGLHRRCRRKPPEWQRFSRS